MKRHPIITRIEQGLRAKLRAQLNARTAEILTSISQEVEAARETRETVTMEITITLEIHPEATQPTP